MPFQSYSESRVALIDSYIQKSLDSCRRQVSQRFGRLIDAMDYSLDGGGKRLRPLLVIATAECLGLRADQVLPAACAMEFIHTYSLVHDDLPALDDDDTRRGKPSSHKEFGEAVAILTGDALLTEAFNQITQLSKSGPFRPEQVVAAIGTLAHYAGVPGMVGGQLLDVTADTESLNLPEVEFIHIHKTGALILCSVLLATHLAECPPDRLQRLRRFGEALGLGFQISDDILDSEAQFRYSRGPRKKPKPSYAQVMSPSEMKEKLNRLMDTAVECLLSEGDKGKALAGIAEFVRTRRR